jgi:hypothetical protein
VPEIETGFEIRKRIWNHVKLATPPRPTPNVLLWLRRDKFPRSITNVQAMIDIITGYGLNYTCVCQRLVFLFLVLSSRVCAAVWLWDATYCDASAS